MDWLIIISRVWELYIFNPEPEYIDHWPTNVYLPTSECVWLISILGRWRPRRIRSESAEREQSGDWIIISQYERLLVTRSITNTPYILLSPPSVFAIALWTYCVKYEIWCLRAMSLFAEMLRAKRCVPFDAQSSSQFIIFLRTKVFLSLHASSS